MTLHCRNERNIIVVNITCTLGTGTASIKVADVNDMPPRFVKEEWVTEVDETDGETLPENAILTVTVHDDDETNDFYYKVQYFVN